MVASAPDDLHEKRPYPLHEVAAVFGEKVYVAVRLPLAGQQPAEREKARDASGGRARSAQRQKPPARVADPENFLTFVCANAAVRPTIV